MDSQVSCPAAKISENPAKLTHIEPHPTVLKPLNHHLLSFSSLILQNWKYSLDYSHTVITCLENICGWLYKSGLFQFTFVFKSKGQVCIEIIFTGACKKLHSL